MVLTREVLGFSILLAVVALILIMLGITLLIFIIFYLLWLILKIFIIINKNSKILRTVDTGVKMIWKNLTWKFLMIYVLALAFSPFISAVIVFLCRIGGFFVLHYKPEWLIHIVWCCLILVTYARASISVFFYSAAKISIFFVFLFGIGYIFVVFGMVMFYYRRYI